MTREEAIKHIKDIICENNTVKHSDMVVFENEKEALRMAIKALSQEPCDDWYDIPSDEMTLEQTRQAVKDLRKKLAEHLEQKPCEDTISREDAIMAIEWGIECTAEEWKKDGRALCTKKNKRITFRQSATV